ncbi:MULTISPECIES: hypothetical protein [Duncaniella]|uniref:Uncharacterized protein n=1 Tax=Duncaniella dubosii TaxID=2518971 RepID=A0A4P7VZR2_9BACT|nr:MULTISPECIES: hypothetical protein [Duncaniella]MBJ2189722.1 hypothetical protein [Muribaculaceae bacterium]MCX4284994.1 hypothetical protein [Duncaniella dubosii]QCD40942.1 hypothetical protein E7747_00650 [Duncaniella dubosii]
MTLEIENITLEDCYSILKPYQRRIVEKLVEKYGIEGAAEKWLLAKGPCQTSTFGGVTQDDKQQNDYWSRFRYEFDKLLCGHQDYEIEREKFVGTSKTIGLAGITAISTWIGPLIGLSPVLLVPSVALLLTTISKMGIKAYCSIKSFE